MLPRIAALSLPGLLAAQDLTNLPLPRTEVYAANTSVDPSGGNEDSGHYLTSRPDGARVLAEFSGPGRLVRLWSAEPHGDVVLEVDGEVRHRGPFRALFDGSTPPFVAPLAAPFAGGWLNHVEVPFERSCRLSAPPGPGTYHQISALLGPRPVAVPLPPVSPPMAPRAVALGAADTVLLDVPGPAEVVELALRCRGLDPRLVWLTAVADDAREPTLQGPLDLFLPVDLPTAATVAGADGLVALRLPMPFARRFVLSARSLAGAGELDVGCTVRPLPAGHGRRYLHARFHRANTRYGEGLPVLALDGRAGHFVGLAAELCGGPAQGLSFLEGDETVVCDGNVVLRGTGTEDFFSGGWYFRGNPVGSPCAAVAAIDPRWCRVRTARFLLVDPMPFQRQFAFALEHGGGNDAAGADYAVLAFWYDDRADGVPRGADALAPDAPRPAPQWDDVPALQVFPDAPVGLGTARLAAGRHALPVAAEARCYTPFCGGRTVLPTVLVEAGQTGWLAVAEPTAVDTVRVERALPAIRQWRVVGPFAGGARAGLDRGHAPARDSGEDRSYDVLGDGPRTWRLVDVTSGSGVLDLDPLCGRRDEVVAYAATWLSSPKDQDVVLWLGSDDAVRVYVDGKAVHEHRGVRGAARDQDRVPLRLAKGEHELLLEVEDYHGGFGCFARIEGDGVTSRGFRRR